MLRSMLRKYVCINMLLRQNIEKHFYTKETFLFKKYKYCRE